MRGAAYAPTNKGGLAMRQAPFRLTLFAVFATTLGWARPAPIVVPTDYPTIQAAIDAAKPGRTISILGGTYTEQIVLSKKLTLVGAGMDVTVIRAPATLVDGQLGSPSIVEVYGGADVVISSLTVKGPGAAACGEPGVLRWGIKVHSNAHLDLLNAAVRDI